MGAIKKALNYAVQHPIKTAYTISNPVVAGSLAKIEKNANSGGFWSDPFGAQAALTKLFTGNKKSKSGSSSSYSFDASAYGSDGSSDSYGYGGGGGYYTLDPSGMIAAYQQQAAADRDAAKATYETTRNDLLTSLKRFQEENAQQQANQRKSYLTGQASLESAREQADRQSRISAAARGLGGSGLQQLAQLQNLLNQGQDISNLATSNQSAMDKLRTLLAQKEEDTDTNLNKATTVYNNALNQINATLAKNIAEAEMARANSYVSGGGGYSSGSDYDTGGLTSDLASLLTAYNSGAKDSNGKLLYKNLDDAKQGIYDIGVGYNIGANNKSLQQAIADATKISQSKSKSKKKKKK